MEEIYLGNIKGVKGDKGEKGEKGDKGEQGGSSSTIIIASEESKKKSSADYIVKKGEYVDVYIEKALNVLPSPGGKITLLEGTYDIGRTIDINKNNVTIEGIENATKIDIPSMLGNPIFKAVNAENLVIKNLTFIGNVETDKFDKVISPYNKTKIINCTFYNLGETIGIYIYSDIHGVIIKDCQFILGNNTPIFIMGNDNIVKNCLFDKTKRIVVNTGENNLIQGNSFKGNDSEAILIHTVCENTAIALNHFTYGSEINNRSESTILVSNINEKVVKR